MSEYDASFFVAKKYLSNYPTRYFGEIVKFFLKCLVGGGKCDSILDSVDKLHNLCLSIHIGA